MEKFNMDNKVVLITGASSGIGKGSAELLATAGAKVFITARRKERLEEIKKDIEDKGGICDCYACDLSTEENCKAAVDTCVKRFGNLDVLVNSAGTSGGAKSTLKEHFDTDNFNKVMKTDFDSVFFMIKYAYEECAKNGAGSIINIASVAALHAAGPVVYTAAKGAIRSLTRLLGKSFAPLGVRINSVYPGLIITEMTEGAMAYPDMWASMVGEIPLGHPGKVEDIAYCVLYLASDASSFVTGQDFVVDGGVTC